MNYIRSSYPIAVLLLVGTAIMATAEMREWEHESGKKINAELVNADDDQATLRRSNGKEGKIARSELSVQDQQYIIDWLSTQNAPLEWCEFGANRKQGDCFELTLYDCKYTKNGDKSKLYSGLYDADGVGNSSHIQECKFDFIELTNKLGANKSASSSPDWIKSILSEYLVSENIYYPNCLTGMSLTNQEMHELFGLPEGSNPSMTIIHLSGNIYSEKSGKYRFNLPALQYGSSEDWGVFLVKVDGNLVNASYTDYSFLHREYKDADVLTNREENPRDEWFELRGKKPVQIDIIVGFMGNQKSIIPALMIEEEGASYNMVKKNENADNQRPVLPLFKLSELDEGYLLEVTRNISSAVNANRYTLEGPVFGVGEEK